jgi:hypothetical protein
MSVESIGGYAREKGFQSTTLERWLGWDQPARDALFRLVLELKIGENHLRDFMDWLEEIALRDQCKIEEVLASTAIVEIESDPRFARADKLKRIKEQVRRLRFPRLAQAEGTIRLKIQELKLHPEIRIAAPPGLEGKLQVQLSASSYSELKTLAVKLIAAVDKDPVREIFDLLAGQDVKR